MDGASSRDRAIYVISVAAELAGVHPQTLRIYERKGLLHPQRTAGNTRRYSDSDIALLRKIQELTNEGINLAGVVRILELEDEIERTRVLHFDAVAELENAIDELQLIADQRDSMALVPLREVRRVRRVLRADIIEQAGRRTFIAPPISSSPGE
ncbi:MAG: heat shock protein transcriptional repressor HspR [Actinomycetota bacterium]